MAKIRQCRGLRLYPGNVFSDSDKQPGIAALAAGNPIRKSSGKIVFQTVKLYISKKHHKGEFVLVKVFDPCSYSILHYVEIERQVLQLEFRYIHNAYETEQLQKSQKLSSEGLFVELEPVSVPVYRKYERIAKRQLKWL